MLKPHDNGEEIERIMAYKSLLSRQGMLRGPFFVPFMQA
jgi:hypothetical protein